MLNVIGRPRKQTFIATLVVMLLCICVGGASAQNNAKQEVKPTTEQTTKKGKKISVKKFKKMERERLSKDTLPDQRRFEVVGGVLKEIGKPVLTDSVERAVIVPDSILNDTIAVDSLNKILSKREQRRLERELLDSTHVRHSAIFRDSISISKMTAISFVAPGFGQLYNRQAWKIPVLYGVVGTALYGGIRYNKVYQDYKRTYDGLVRKGATQEQMSPSQYGMIKYNTYRQIFFAGALATYIYFIGDAAVNYDGAATSVKKATTLSTICPGAGQIYNKSYWKLPIVMGGFATMAYIIDFNSRGYKRFKLAYDLLTDGDDSTVDEFKGQYSEENLRNYRNSYRRNRDLSIIITGMFYLLNIVDAHVDAHLKDYDISDNLAFDLTPSMTNFYSQTSGTRNIMGMSLSFRF